MFIFIVLFILIFVLLYFYCNYRYPENPPDESFLEDRFEDYIRMILQGEQKNSSDSSSGNLENFSQDNEQTLLEDWLNEHNIEELGLDKDLQIGPDQWLMVFGVNHHITIKASWQTSFEWTNHRQIIEPPNRNSVFWHISMTAWPERGRLKISKDDPLTIHHRVNTTKSIIRPRVFRLTSSSDQSKVKFREDNSEF
jgi:hypothetical protein